MNPEDTDELTPGERDAFDSLPRAMAPPSWLEERIVSELKASGRIRPGHAARRWIAAVGTLAASLILFVAGLSAGRYMERQPSAAASGPRFMLLLYEDAGYLAPEPAGSASRVAEYADWARSLSREGRFAGGEKLKDAAEIVSTGEGVLPHEPGRLAGYFIIAASGRTEAAAIARRCPHLRYGGTIIVREIDPT